MPDDENSPPPEPDGDEDAGAQTAEEPENVPGHPLRAQDVTALLAKEIA